jgi:hypothetical protein
MKYPNYDTMRIYLCQACLFVFSLTAFSQAPAIAWQKSLGGTSGDILNSIQSTSDGGFIVAGYSSSSNGDVIGNQGSFDYWVAKLTSTGTITWKKTLGGSGMDIATCVQQTSDGGYIVSGNSNSTNSDVANNIGGIDYWILKLAANGNVIWQKSLGGTVYDYGNEIQETTDGGYVIVGYTNSTNGDITGNHGNYDCWVVKMDALGTLVWQKSLGGSLLDQAFSIQQTSDGGYIFAGATSSQDGNVTANHGSDDCWIVKLDSLGNLIWQKSFGGPSQDFAYSILQTADGGYVFTGFTTSAGGDVSVTHGGRDCWVVKLDSTGTLVWEHALGGTLSEIATQIIQTQDGNYLISAYSASSNGDLTTSNGQDDFWVVKINTSGDVLWQKSMGGSGIDQAHGLDQATDGGYVVVGSSTSNTGDVSGNHGSTDFWVVKLASEDLSVPALEVHHPLVFPNPSNRFITLIHGSSEESFHYKIVDATGKIVAIGFTKYSNPIAIETLKSGNYILMLSTESGMNSNLKFVKN